MSVSAMRAKALELEAMVHHRYNSNGVGVFVCRGCGLELAMFVFLVLAILYPNGTLAGFAKATKTCPAAKWYWRQLNSKRSLPVLKWTSKSEFSLSFADIYK